MNVPLRTAFLITSNLLSRIQLISDAVSTEHLSNMPLDERIGFKLKIHRDLVGGKGNYFVRYRGFSEKW